MNRAKVRVLEHAGDVSFGGLLQRKKSQRLKAVVGAVGDFDREFAHEPLERELADEKVCCLLVFADFTQSDRARAKPMNLLDGRHLYARSFGRELFARSLAARRNARSLLGTRHTVCCR